MYVCMYVCNSKIQQVQQTHKLEPAGSKRSKYKNETKLKQNLNKNKDLKNDKQ